MRIGSLVFIVLIVLSVIRVSSVFAEPGIDGDPNRLFYRGNDLYAEGKYSEAIEEYSRIVEEGYENGGLYYNLGNSYFKIGDIGRAILNYERAKRLIPRDADLESNYRHARSLVEGQTYTPNYNFVMRFIRNMFSQFTINEITLLLSIIFVIVTVILIAAVYIGPKRNLIITIAILGLVFVVGVIALNQKSGAIGKESVVVTESTEAKFEPFDRATTHFTLYEGMKVNKIIDKEDWYKIKRLDGKAGWIKKTSLEVI